MNQHPLPSLHLCNPLQAPNSSPSCNRNPSSCLPTQQSRLPCNVCRRHIHMRPKSPTTQRNHLVSDMQPTCIALNNNSRAFKSDVPLMIWEQLRLQNDQHVSEVHPTCPNCNPYNAFRKCVASLLWCWLRYRNETQRTQCLSANVQPILSIWNTQCHTSSLHCLALFLSLCSCEKCSLAIQTRYKSLSSCRSPQHHLLLAHFPREYFLHNRFRNLPCNPHVCKIHSRVHVNAHTIQLGYLDFDHSCKPKHRRLQWIHRFPFLCPTCHNA